MAADQIGRTPRSVTTEELMAAAGYEITDEGKARARAKLEEARARRTPERKAAFRRQIRGDSADAA
jgi:DNA-binding PadR family transcriptional regulator